MHWPLSTTVIVTQPFGVNGDYYRKNGIDIDGHNGLDLLAYHGQPVYASHDGFASYQVDSKGGHGITIRSSEKATILGTETYYKTGYWHLCDFIQEPQYKPNIPTDGEEYPVKLGDTIGYADSTGLSSGDHVHFFIKPITRFGNRWNNARQNNGYGGCVDPSFYMSQYSAQDYVKKINVARETLAGAEKTLIYLQKLPASQQGPILAMLSNLLSGLSKLFK